MLDRRLVEQVAEDLGTSPGLIEKDWHVVRAIGVIAEVDTAAMMPAFSGGTSLSKGWELIKRFSEDIDFKVGEPTASSASRARRERTAYRHRVLEALTARLSSSSRSRTSATKAVSFRPTSPMARNSERGRGYGRISASRCRFGQPALPPVARPIRSLIAIAQRQPPEIAAFPCVDPVETAADKLSALAWRVRARDRTKADDDPTIVRHLHDLAALERHVASAPRFRELVIAAVAADVGRGGGTPAGRSGDDVRRHAAPAGTDPLWAREYEDFVRQVSFAGPGEAIHFPDALAACARLVFSAYESGEINQVK